MAKLPAPMEPPTPPQPMPLPEDLVLPDDAPEPIPEVPTGPIEEPAP